MTLDLKTDEEKKYEIELLKWINLWTDRDSYHQLIHYTPIPSWVNDPKFNHIRDHYIQYHNSSYASRGGQYRHRWELQNRVKIEEVNTQLIVKKYFNPAKKIYSYTNSGNARFKILFQGRSEIKDAILKYLAENYGGLDATPISPLSSTNEKKKSKIPIQTHCLICGGVLENISTESDIDKYCAICNRKYPYWETVEHKEKCPICSKGILVCRKSK